MQQKSFNLVENNKCKDNLLKLDKNYLYNILSEDGEYNVDVDINCIQEQCIDISNFPKNIFY